MQKNVCYHTAIYLRLSRDDEDIDGSAKEKVTAFHLSGSWLVPL